MSAITNLEPRIVWEQFDAITRVPRPSKKEGRIIEFLVDFARKHNLEYKKDAIGNVVMRKPATPGFENRPTVILQSHMDMVCEKNSDVEFDFDRDPIRTRIDGGWVRAEGTTLGADCGIGMAAALAVLIDPAVEHGPVEALFTVDEETGLTGAFELGEDMLTGKYLVNLDSEDEGEIFIGCAGGIDTVATFRYTMEEAPKNYAFFRVDVSDLQGGHSGDDIDKGRVNSNKTVARLLWDGMQSYELKLSWFDGGNLRNAIPREAYAIFGVPVRFKDEFIKRYKLFAADLEAEFRLREPNFKITLNEMPQVDRRGGKLQYREQQQHIHRRRAVRLREPEHQREQPVQHQQEQRIEPAALYIFPQQLHSTIYPMPFFVAMKFSSPAPSSFLRRRATFTLSVFSSTKLSDSHSRCISTSRETVLPLFSISTCRIRYSFFVSSTRSP